MASVSRAKVSYIFRIRLANVLVSPSEFQVFRLLLVDLGIHLHRERKLHNKAGVETDQSQSMFTSAAPRHC